MRTIKLFLGIFGLVTCTYVFLYTASEAAFKLSRWKNGGAEHFVGVFTVFGDAIVDSATRRIITSKDYPQRIRLATAVDNMTDLLFISNNFEDIEKLGILQNSDVLVESIRKEYTGQCKISLLAKLLTGEAVTVSFYVLRPDFTLTKTQADCITDEFIAQLGSDKKPSPELTMTPCLTD